MKVLRFLVCFAGATTLAVAQTFQPVPDASAPTNQPAAQPQSGPQAGVTQQQRTISLQETIQEALEHNLDLQIERYNPEFSLYSLKSIYGDYDPGVSFSAEHSYNETAGSGFDPDTGLPRLGSKTKEDTVIGGIDGLLPWGMTYNFGGNLSEVYGTSIGTNGFDNTRGQVGVSVSQPLLKNLWIDATRLNIAVSKNRLKFSESVLTLRIMTIATTVENAYYDLIAARENIKVREKALELANRLLAENKKRVEVGAMAPLDEKQAQAQVATARADLLSARQIEDSQQNVLKSLLSDNYLSIHDVELVPAESLVAPVQIFNLQDSWGKGINSRPELQQAKLDLERQGIQLKYDRNQLFPQLDVFGSYGYNAGGPTTVEFSDGLRDFRERDFPYYSYGARISFPLTVRRERYNYKATKVSIKQGLLVVKQMEQSILTEIDNAVIAAQASYERVDATHQARLYAESALDAEQKKLESGKSTSFFVLQLQRDLTAAQSEEIQALADYNKALANLSLSEASTLQRRSINLQVK